MNEQNTAFYEDEIDLRELLAALLGGWKVILTLTLLAGAAAFGFSSLQQPVYEASAVVTIGQSATLVIGQGATLIKVSPASWPTGDEARQMVADMLGMETSAVPAVTVTQDRTDKTRFTIMVQASSAAQAAQTANAWAEAGVAWFVQQVSSAASLEDARQSFAEADQALLEHLQKNDLESLSWGELAWLTGIGNIQT